MYSTIRKNLVYEFIFSFIVAFLFFFFIFFVNQLLLLAEEILSKNVSLHNVFLIILYSLPSITSFTFPFASLVGALMAVSRLSSDNEILAYQASGIRYRTLFFPFLIIGIILSVFSFITNDYFLPVSTLKFSKLYREILYSTPELELQSNSIKKYQNTTLITGKVEGTLIKNLVIIDKTSKNNKRILNAQYAEIVPSSIQKGISSIELHNILSITPQNKQKNKFNYFYSDKMIYNIILKSNSFSLKSLSPREMSSKDIYTSIRIKEKKQKERIQQNLFQIRSLKETLSNEYIDMIKDNTNNAIIKNTFNRLNKLQNKIFFDRSLQIYKLEFYKKFSIAFASLIFVFFAFPLSLYSRKNGRSTGFGIGLFISIIYWSMLFAGQTIAIRMYIPPFIAMWSPNILIFILGSLLMIKRYKR